MIVAQFLVGVIVSMIDPFVAIFGVVIGVLANRVNPMIALVVYGIAGALWIAVLASGGGAYYGILQILAALLWSGLAYSALSL